MKDLKQYVNSDQMVGGVGQSLGAIACLTPSVVPWSLMCSEEKGSSTKK
jgi:hypothetical protein